MASNTETVTTFTDDIDGTQAEGTVTFALDGKHYEIDLSFENRAELEARLANFIISARRAAPDNREKPSDVRAWAREMGYDVKDKGRVEPKILDAYREAQG